MAKAIPPYTFQNGFKQPSSEPPWLFALDDTADNEDPEEYTPPPSKELVTSSLQNSVGINITRHWPTLYDGTNNPHGLPSGWKPSKEVDVLIVGAGPSGLQVAMSLARQNVSFRIIDKAEGPLTVGRADGVQPRFLETAALWGIADEISEEGPLIERTAIYKDGKKLLFNNSHQCDSRYRGLHIITQGQLERIYIRDLARHGVIVERSSVLNSYAINSSNTVEATVLNERTGQEDHVRAKFLVGSDGATSMIRKQLNIPFDGVSTDIYWGIMDCVYKSDYPHAWVFGTVISSTHGGCVIIPREDGYIRLYTQLDVSATGSIAKSRQASDSSFNESGGQLDIHSVTPEEVLEQANRIFAPYKLSFAAPLSWFAVWKISERVARSYSSLDMTTHLVGDAAHVHSVMGAFGLNASILDSANLAWKLGLVAKGEAKRELLLPTYSEERRSHGVRIIETSGRYLRFVCGSDMPLPNLRDVAALDQADSKAPKPNGHSNKETPPQEEQDDLAFLASFFKVNGPFLLGVDCPYSKSILTPPQAPPSERPSLRVDNGVRAPNPRVCFSTTKTGYLYDQFAGPPRFHIVIFLSSLSGKAIRNYALTFTRSLPKWYHRFGGRDRFNLVIVLKCLPFELERKKSEMGEEAATLWREATVVFDDRAPDEDAHSIWGANHGTGGVAVVRPDLWVGLTCAPGKSEKLVGYFDGFLLDTSDE